LLIIVCLSLFIGNLFLILNFVVIYRNSNETNINLLNKNCQRDFKYYNVLKSDCQKFDFLLYLFAYYFL